jgi:hypothetical protein
VEDPEEFIPETGRGTDWLEPNMQAIVGMCKAELSTATSGLAATMRCRSVESGSISAWRRLVSMTGHCG